MDSPKSSMPVAATAAKKPQRQRGRIRVNALMDSAADVFGEKGYEGATMTEIAARAGAAIGSLYQFFPSKDAIADALITLYAGNIEAVLSEIASDLPRLDTQTLADRLLDLPVRLASERALAMTLIDARRERSSCADSFRHAILARLSALLRARSPHLDEADLAVVADVVLLAMKAMPLPADAQAGCAGEWRRMLRLYLIDRLGP